MGNIRIKSFIGSKCYYNCKIFVNSRNLRNFMTKYFEKFTICKYFEVLRRNLYEVLQIVTLRSVNLRSVTRIVKSSQTHVMFRKPMNNKPSKYFVSLRRFYDYSNTSKVYT